MKIFKKRHLDLYCFISVLICYPTLSVSFHNHNQTEERETEFDEPISPERMATSLPSSFAASAGFFVEQAARFIGRARALSVCSMEQDIPADKEMDDQPESTGFTFSLQMFRDKDKNFTLVYNGKRTELTAAQVFCQDKGKQSSVEKIEQAGAQFNKIEPCLLEKAYQLLNALRSNKSDCDKGSYIYEQFNSFGFIDSQTGQLTNAAYLLPSFCEIQGFTKKFGSYNRNGNDLLTLSYDKERNPTIVIDKSGRSNVSFQLKSPSSETQFSFDSFE